MHSNISYLSLITFSLSLLIASCGGGNKNNSPASQKTLNNKTSCTAGNTQVSSTTDGIQKIKINAASYDCWGYISLANGKQVKLSDKQAKASNQWHLAFKRNQIKANGGDSGTGKVSVALADKQAEFYNSDKKPISDKFINASADAYQDDLKKIYDASTLSFKMDSDTPAIKDWYVYNRSTHKISANTDNFWIIQNSDDSAYVKFRLTQASYDSIGFEYHLQTAADAQFQSTKKTLTANVDKTKKEVCIDFDTAKTLDCTDKNWDIRYESNPQERKINLWLNSTIYGGGKGKALNLKSAQWSVKQYASVDSIIKRHLQEDKSSSVLEDKDKTWWAYNLRGQHKLWPNFRTYVIKIKNKSTTDYYNLQVVNYYSLGDSGSPEIHLYKSREK